MPDNGSMQLSELEAMVREVNATQVAPEDRLSDKVQYYDRETKLLQRGQEKSVLGRLSDKKHSFSRRITQHQSSRTAVK